MKLFINTSVVPFKMPTNGRSASWVQACPVGRMEGTAMQDDFVGRWISRRELLSATESRRENARRVGVEGNGPTPGGQGCARFWSHPLLPRLTYGRGFPLLFWCRGRRGHAKHHENWRNREAQD
jgi:hypothetical protein